jgi:SAM-dependent methyltransferase
VAEATEGATERERRRYQRGLFDTVARLYEATRPGYPPELAGFIAETAGAVAGSAVLEVGCGTGQLTKVLAPFGFTLTAIDVGASLTGGGVAFLAVSFEENTRATSLSWPDEVRRAFSAELRELLGRLWPLGTRAAVGVTVTSSVTMAPVLAAAAGA